MKVSGRQAESSWSPLTPSAKVVQRTEGTLLDLTEWPTSLDPESWTVDYATYACLWNDEQPLSSLWSNEELDSQQVELPLSTERNILTLNSPGQPCNPSGNDLLTAQLPMKEVKEARASVLDDMAASRALPEGSNLLTLAQRTVHTAGGGTISVRFRDDRALNADTSLAQSVCEEAAFTEARGFLGASTVCCHTGGHVAAQVLCRDGNMKSCDTGPKNQVYMKAADSDDFIGASGFAPDASAPGKEITSPLPWTADHRQVPAWPRHARRIRAPLNLENTLRSTNMALGPEQQIDDKGLPGSGDTSPRKPSTAPEDFEDFGSTAVGVDRIERDSALSGEASAILDSQSALHCAEWLHEWNESADPWRTSMASSGLASTPNLHSSSRGNLIDPETTATSASNLPAYNICGGLLPGTLQTTVIAIDCFQTAHGDAPTTTRWQTSREAETGEARHQGMSLQRCQIGDVLKQKRSRERDYLEDSMDQVPADAHFNAMLHMSKSLVQGDDDDDVPQQTSVTYATPARKRQRRCDDPPGHRHSLHAGLPPLQSTAHPLATGNNAADLDSRRSLRDFVVNRIGAFRRIVPRLREAGPYWQLENGTTWRAPVVLADPTPALHLL
jgi:hypothetical protein